MLEYFWGLLQSVGKNGKTATGMAMVVLSTFLASLSPEDLALIQQLIANGGIASVGLAGGVGLGTLGLAHKAWKAVQAARAQPVQPTALR